jgi:hypothetical protein
MSSTKLYRLSGLALILGALIMIVSTPISGAHTGISAYSNPLHLPARLLQIVGGILLLIGLPGLYLRQANKASKLGLVSFVMTFLGIAAHWHLLPTLSFVSVLLAARPETQDLVAGGGVEQHLGALLGGYFVLSVLIMSVGIILLGIATLRARVFPRGAAVLLIVSIPASMLAIFISNAMNQGPMGYIVAGIGAALFVLGFAWCGYALLAEDEQVHEKVVRQTDMRQPAA